jgi:hypothetical protein
MRIDCPYDPEAPFGTTRSITWTGYKVHGTETCEDDAPHIITHVETTEAAVTDVTMTKPIQQAFYKKGVAPEHHIVDAGYVDATLLVESPRDFHITLIGPVRPDISWQAKDEQAYDISRFHIDWVAQQVTCPRAKRDRHGDQARINGRMRSFMSSLPIRTVALVRPGNAVPKPRRIRVILPSDPNTNTTPSKPSGTSRRPWTGKRPMTNELELKARSHKGYAPLGCVSAGMRAYQKRDSNTWRRLPP